MKSLIFRTPPASLERFRGKVCKKPQIIIHLQHTSGEFGLFPGGGVCSEEKNRKEKQKEKQKEKEKEKEKRRRREGGEKEERSRDRSRKDGGRRGSCRQDYYQYRSRRREKLKRSAQAERREKLKRSAQAEEAGEAGANDF